ncbi:MAG: hypothetical protein KGJ78_11730 [Alphaproteobacteria bacterium]|nr:hypothetical protein [Alphaproteobacteria bacterium]
MKSFSRVLKAAVLVAGLAAIVGGCASGYYDRDGNYHYYHGGYYDRDGYYNRHDSDRDRRWVCDADGDDCHWEYRQGY